MRGYLIDSERRIIEEINFEPVIIAALAQPLPQPMPPGPGGSCAHGWSRSGSFCVPCAGAQDRCRQMDLSP
jgi:hypothetical protein